MASKPQSAGAKRQHQLSFVFPAESKKNIDNWCNSCAHFFITVLLDVDPQLEQTLLTESIRQRAKAYEIEEEEDEEAASGLEFKEALESLSVHLLVHLISMLGSLIN
jgi:hypothetical protein